MLGALLGVIVGCGCAVLIVPDMVRGVVRACTCVLANGRQFAITHAARTHAEDLSVVGWTSPDLVTRQLLGIIVGGVSLALPISWWGSGVVALAFAVIGGVAGFTVPPLFLRSRARHRRRTFTHAFSAYLDLMNVLLAGGAGIETASTAAAEAGDGWAFSAMRSAVARARLLRRPVWSEFATLSNRWGIEEVAEVAGSMSLSGEFGANIRAALAARADSMRARQIAEVEAAAQSATERMGLPMMLLFVGFVSLLGYPALQTVVMSM